MQVINNQVGELKKLWKNKRVLSYQVLNLAMIVFSALMIWKGLIVVTKSEVRAELPVKLCVSALRGSAGKRRTRT